MDPTRETTTRSSEQGFTLVELMTALTITVVLTGAMLGLGQRAQAGATRVTRDVEVLESWRDTLAQVAQDLRCASTVASGGGRVILTGGPNDVMWSVRQGHLTRSEGGRTTRDLPGVADLRVHTEGALHRIDLAVHRPDNRRVMEFSVAVATRLEEVR